MSHLSKKRQCIWPVVLTFVCLIVLHLQGTAAIAQSGFRPSGNSGGNSAYQDGQAKQNTPGVSNFKADPGRQIPSFGRNTNPSAFRSNGSQIQDQTLVPQIGTTSGTDVGEFAFCTVEFSDEIDIPALETGQLNEMSVKEGDSVGANQEIGTIDDTLLKLQLMQALVRKQNAYRIANDTTAIEAAKKQIQLTRQRYETTARLERKGARSADEKQTARYEYEVALLQREAARSRQLEAQGEAELETAREAEVKERIVRHKVKSRFEGVVVDRYKQAGEWVTAGEPVAKIARMDRLYVTGLISNLEYNPSEIIGKDVVVTVKLARDEEMEFTGKIAIIGSKDIRGSGNEFKVKAEITNKKKQGQWVLRKETRVSMRINVN